MVIKIFWLALLVLSIVLIDGQSAFAFDKIKTWDVDPYFAKISVENQSDTDDYELDGILPPANFSIALFSHVITHNLNPIAIYSSSFSASFIRALPVNS